MHSIPFFIYDENYLSTTKTIRTQIKAEMTRLLILNSQLSKGILQFSIDSAAIEEVDKFFNLRIIITKNGESKNSVKFMGC